MMNFLYNLIIEPLRMLFEYLFNIIFTELHNTGFTIFVISFFVFAITLPLYLRAEKIQKEENEIQKKLSPRANIIKKYYSGDERLFLLQTYYKQNNYHPVMALRLSLSLLLQIPVFMGAYVFFSNLELLNEAHLYLIKDLSLPDNLLYLGSFKVNLLPFLMTVVNLLAGFIYAKSLSFKENKTHIIISLVFLILLYNSPSALVLYWLFNNFFSLVKNICLKVFSSKNMVIYCSILASFVYLWFAKTEAVVAVLLIIFAYQLDKIKLENFKINSKSLYIFAITCYFFFVGVYLPSNIISSSPLEFIQGDIVPTGLLKYAITVFAGCLLFWGGWIYYFADEKLRKILSVSTLLLLVYSFVSCYTIKMPPALLSNLLTFETDNSVFDFYVLKQGSLAYAGILVFAILFMAYLLKKNPKLVNRILGVMILSFAIISLNNYLNISKKVSDYLVSKNNEQSMDKYIKLSKNNKNVLVIFLDRAIGAFLPVIFNEHPYLKSKYNGFTYYPNTLSYAGYTLIGYLPILGGYEYTPFEADKRNETFKTKFNESLTVLPTIFSGQNWISTVVNPIGNGWESELYHGGVNMKEVKNLAENGLYDKFSINHYDIPESVTTRFNTSLRLTDSSIIKHNLICFSLLNTLHPALRKELYDNGNYNSSVTVSREQKHAHNRFFIKNYTELLHLSDLTDFSQKNNAFIVYNSRLPHFPALFNYPNYDFSEIDDINYNPPIPKDDRHSLTHYHVNVATLKLLGDYLDFLRKNGVYDNTRIIVVADHGFGYGLKSPNISPSIADKFLPYNPLLLVKDFNQNGSFKTSDEFMTNADVSFISTKGIFNEIKNPYTGKIMKQDKDNGILIKDDVKWTPNTYLGKNKMLSESDSFHFVKDDPIKPDNWLSGIGYQKALELSNKK